MGAQEIVHGAQIYVQLTPGQQGVTLSEDKS